MARTALVVGGTSGIGAATALRLAADGATVIAAGLNTAAASPELRQAVELHELDLRTPGALEDLITSHPRLDVLVNAAGIIRRGDEHRPEVFAEVVEINLTGAMRAAAAAHELLAESKGCIVNVASMLSYFGGPLVPGYSASKGGIVQLTKSLAVAWAAEGIRVNAVAPGWIATDLTAALQADPVAAERILSRTPMARWGRAAEVAGAIAFLTGPDATFITGAVLPVDGGYQSN
ncbi:NAD(P)-dependent dehydrogenase (short-subunit alcohol dehydrogenase family) [Kribbella orskensis]|uniref:NAD(P)-dependent dehydrogenase (Short-subunit alcohol dehydrogenase family) n=1 Tax=Kribbella orskensis TaxID=2512216 RepID=A0ABY2BK47_9ACTN|nr:MULTISPECIES: SDR family oxidoreductase [Kribbella]TCN38387.1 NAD(P)-dependent dehydrogenase (short-subunit alcohol dehydrogenase family) [Kribbella sp. VKM Ac-2500]TCO20083.1 NAD(P)-dependent dehydrogenase (short-subunit alcohol dehydrogenase family) [Kribbella orskensis]